MEGQINKIFNSISSSLKEGPKSISEISKDAKINWRTAEAYLNTLKNLGLASEINLKNTRTFLYKDKDNYFDLPIKKSHKKLISTIYHYTKLFCNEFYKKDPTKTQVYKIIWKINKETNLSLPIGWYKYGPCCIQIYKNEEKQELKLSKSILHLLKNITKEYCAYDSAELKKQVYAEDKLYTTKEKLITASFKDKKEINPVLMELIKNAPKESIEVATDFARATLLLGFPKTSDCFEKVWAYIALVRLKESLSEYYGSQLSYYLDEKIAFSKQEAQLYITDLVRSK